MSMRFADVYNCFLNKITDDLYLELTPEDTLKDIQNLLLNSIPYFEFPRKNLNEYYLDVVEINKSAILEDDFVIGPKGQKPGPLDEFVEMPPIEEDDDPIMVVDRSMFGVELSDEEVNILAIIMMNHWLNRQVVSIENIRMKYSGSDFKMTSQANHLSKLLTLMEETRRQNLHMQRLYKRRKVEDNGSIRSNWSTFRESSALRDN